LNDEIATGLDAAKQNAIDVEGVRVGDDVDQVADDVARVEGDADAAILEADAARRAEADAATIEGGRVEAEKARDAQAKLGFQEWIDKNYPRGLRGKRKQKAIDEYNKYKKENVTGAPPEKPTFEDSPRAPKGKKKLAPYLTKRARMFDQTIDNISRVNRKAGTRLKTYINKWEVGSSKRVAISNRIRKDAGIKKGEHRMVVHALNGTLDEIGIDKLPEHLVQPVARLRTQLNKTFDDVEAAVRKAYELKIAEARSPVAKEALITEMEAKIPKRRQDYFPHMGKRRKAVEMGPTMEEQRAQGFYSGAPAHNLEPRTVGDPDWIDDDLDILNNYFDQVYREASKVEHLGIGTERLRRDLRKFKYDPSTEEHIRLGVNRILGKPGESPRLTAFNSKVRQIAGFLKLTKAGIRQPSQIGSIATVGGVGRTAKVLGKYAFDPKFRKGLEFKAEYSGALRPDVVLDQIGKANQDARNIPFMWGVPTMDRFNRVISYGVGEQLTKAMSKNTKLADEIRNLGFRGNIDNPREVGKWLSDTTQFRGGPAHRPGWTNSEMGKYVTQFYNFSYQQGRLANQILRKDPAKIAKLIVANGTLAAGINQLIAMSKGFNVPGTETLEFDNLPLDEKAAIVFSAERANMDSPLWRFGESLAEDAIFGMYVTAARTAADVYFHDYGNPLLDQMGAAPNIIFEGAEAAQSAIQGNLEPAGRFALRQVPDVPGVGATAAAFTGGRAHSLQEALLPSKAQMGRYRKRRGFGTGPSMFDLDFETDLDLEFDLELE
jgi:hypothetical protein